MRTPRALALILVLLSGCRGAVKEHVTLIANITKGPQTSDAVDLSFASEKLQEEQQDLQGLLNWAISNSDPEELKRQAEQVGSDADAAARLAARQQEIREVMDILKKEPTETDVIKAALETLKKEGVTAAERVSALRMLQPLLEPIDNANGDALDLKDLGGLEPLMGALREDWGGEVNAAAAHCIGTAASNNQVFQEHFMEAFPGVIARLVQMGKSEGEAVAGKALYALGQLVRGNLAARAQFLEGGGKDLMRGLVSGKTSPPGLVRKALDLISDLSVPDGPPVSLSEPAFFDGVMRCLSQDDLDLAEKALYALQALLTVPRNVWVFKAQGLVKKLEELERRVRYAHSEGDLSEEFREDLGALIGDVKKAALQPIKYAPGSDRTIKRDMRPQQGAHDASEL